MQENFEIEAEIRTDLGKGASRRLRLTNKFPAVIYGGGKDSVSLTLTHNVMQLHLEHEAFYSHILTVKVEGKAEKAILRDVQRHPSKPTIMHMDFLRINEKEKLRMNVPLHFENEEECVGVKTGGGLINHIVSQVEVSCLAKDLPEFITVDVANVELGVSLHMSEIALPEGVTLVELEHDHDLAVVNVVKPRGIAEDDEDAPAADAAAGDEAAPEATED